MIYIESWKIATLFILSGVMSYNMYHIGILVGRTMDAVDGVDNDDCGYIEN